MKKFLLGLGLILTLVTPTHAQTNPAFNVTQYRAAFAVETLTVSSTAKILTAATYAPTSGCFSASQCNADYALITVEAASSACMRYWPNSTAPTSSVGHRICDGGTVYIYGYKNIQNFKMIRVTTDVMVQVSYYRFFTNSMQ